MAAAWRQKQASIEVPKGTANPAESIIDGDKWYRLEAFRALNQAVGRCIRHKLDYGCIVLLDQRFTQSSTRNSMSRWVSVSRVANTELDTQSLISQCCTV